MKLWHAIGALALFLFPLSLSAQGKMSAKLSGLAEKGSEIEVSITSSQKFIFGSNRYVLHIAGNTFFRSRQSFNYNTHQGLLVFWVPIAEFKKLPDNAEVYLTYGGAEEPEESLTALAENEYPTCWHLGRLQKSSLK